MTPGRIAAGVFVVALAAGISWFVVPRGGSREVGVTVPALSVAAQAGRSSYDRNCLPCHGENAAGGATGPPLVHRVYHPAHHADIAFELAVRRGVRAHHWRFGDMPAQPALPSEASAQITRYIRELQQANGIY
jgi:mono/diheme cytochrome c family protein